MTLWSAVLSYPEGTLNFRVDKKLKAEDKEKPEGKEKKEENNETPPKEKKP